MNFSKISVLLLLTFSLNVYAQVDSNSGIYPISGIDPNASDAELAPIAKALAGARVVGLGEVSHGTQSDTVRHRLAKYLVEKLGYRIILAEYPMMPSLTPSVQKYLNTCEGDPKQIIQFNYFTFQTTETMEFLKWICQYNVLHPNDRIIVAGADILYHAWLYRMELQKLTAIYATDPNYQLLMAGLRMNCFGARYTNAKEWSDSPEYKEWESTGTLDPASHRDCLMAADEMKKFITQHRAEILNKFSVGQYRMFMIAPGSLIASDTDASDYNSDITGSQTVRDRQMFDNFTTLWQNFGLNKKAIFMAHNYHVAKAQSRKQNLYWPKVVSAGEHFAKWLKGAYKVIGVTAYRVHEFYVSRPPVLPTSTDSLEFNLNQRKESFFLVDPNGSFIRRKPTWYLMADNTLEYPNGERIVPREQYDIILYMRDCLEAHPVAKTIRLSTKP